MTQAASAPGKPALPEPVHLLDTNILLRLIQPSDPHHSVARGAVRELRRRGTELVIVPQNLYEFWTVATRPATARGGLALSPAGAARAVAAWERLYPLREDGPDVLREWKRVVETYGVSGKQAHDARLIAAMKAHGLTHLLTFNGADFNRADFNRYAVGEGITIVDPAGITPPGSTTAVTP